MHRISYHQSIVCFCVQLRLLTNYQFHQKENAVYAQQYAYPLLFCEAHLAEFTRCLRRAKRAALVESDR